jgi:hypothetical protein
MTFRALPAKLQTCFLKQKTVSAWSAFTQFSCTLFRSGARADYLPIALA